jgi:hypothetical protein
LNLYVKYISLKTDTTGDDDKTMNGDRKPETGDRRVIVGCPGQCEIMNEFVWHVPLGRIEDIDLFTGSQSPDWEPDKPINHSSNFKGNQTL